VIPVRKWMRVRLKVPAGCFIGESVQWWWLMTRCEEAEPEGARQGTFWSLVDRGTERLEHVTDCNDMNLFSPPRSNVALAPFNFYCFGNSDFFLLVG